MTTNNWARWPHHATKDSESLEESALKEASAPLFYDEVSPKGLLTAAAVVLPDWIQGIPEGTEKTAALRPDDDDPLPVVTPNNIWRHPNAHPLVLTLILLDQYGPDYLNWEPEALRTTLLKDNRKCSESVWTKILASRVLLLSPAPWRQWEQFHWVSQGLAGKPPNFVYLEKPQIGFLMAAVDAMTVVDHSRPFAEDPAKYVATTLRDAGVPYAPPPLTFAQEELNDRHIECLDCGTLERDDNDVKCVACGSRNLKHIPGAYETEAAAIKSAFMARRKKPLQTAVEGLGHDIIGEATYKLLVHNQYNNEIRAQLIAQLKMLQHQ